jgi:hypothetical protein
MMIYGVRILGYFWVFILSKSTQHTGHDDNPFLIVHLVVDIAGAGMGLDGIYPRTGC